MDRELEPGWGGEIHKLLLDLSDLAGTADILVRVGN